MVSEQGGYRTRPDVWPATTASPSERRQPVVGKRVAAGLIDIGLLFWLFVAFAILFGQFGTTEGPTPGSRSFAANVDGWPFVALLALTFAYFILSEGLLGATPGKKAAGLRVTKSDGSPAGWGAIVSRNLLRLIDGLPFLYIVGIVIVAISAEDQRLGDMAAGTIVVETEPAAVLEPAVSART